MADTVSKSGVYIDTKTGKVVEKQPEEGVQLVAPGGTIDASVQQQIDWAKDAASTSAEAEPVDLSATDKADDSKTVTTRAKRSE